MSENKTKKLYFDCPVKALYMIREFDIKIDGLDKRWGRYAVNQEDILKNFHKYIEEKLYVALESEYIFDNKQFFMPKEEV